MGINTTANFIFNLDLARPKRLLMQTYQSQKTLTSNLQILSLPNALSHFRLNQFHKKIYTERAAVFRVKGEAKIVHFKDITRKRINRRC